jgi:hypothetical protein
MSIVLGILIIFQVMLNIRSEQMSEAKSSTDVVYHVHDICKLKNLVLITTELAKISKVNYNWVLCGSSCANYVEGMMFAVKNGADNFACAMDRCRSVECMKYLIETKKMPNNYDWDDKAYNLAKEFNYKCILYMVEKEIPFNAVYGMPKESWTYKSNGKFFDNSHPPQETPDEKTLINWIETLRTYKHHSSPDKSSSPDQSALNRAIIYRLDNYFAERLRLTKNKSLQSLIHITVGDYVDLKKAEMVWEYVVSEGEEKKIKWNVAETPHQLTYYDYFFQRSTIEGIEWLRKKNGNQPIDYNSMLHFAAQNDNVGLVDYAVKNNMSEFKKNDSKILSDALLSTVYLGSTKTAEYLRQILIDSHTQVNYKMLRDKAIVRGGKFGEIYIKWLDEIGH